MHATKYTVAYVLEDCKGRRTRMGTADTATVFPVGFGERLRAERSRLRLTQTRLAEIGGVKRLAQSQYENECSSPPVRYLAAIGAAGVNLRFVLFADATGSNRLTLDEQSHLEQQAFDLVEEYVHQHPGGNVGAEGRFTLFQLFRAHLVQEALSRTAVPIGLSALVSSIVKINDELSWWL